MTGVVVRLWWTDMFSFSYTKRLKYVAGLIPQSLQLQVQVTANQGRSHKSWECVKSCVRRYVFLQSERWRCQYSTVIMWLRQEDAMVWETRAQGYQAKCRGLHGCKPALKSITFISLITYLMTCSLPQTMTKISGQCTGIIWKETAIL